MRSYSPVLLGTGASFFLIVASILGKNTRFETNDDPGYLFIASGHWSGTPSDQLLFVSRIIGFALRLCYTIAPGIPWYPLAMIFSLALCLIAISCSLLNTPRSPQRSGLIIFYLFVAVQFAPLFTHLQFTKIAVVCAGVGTISLFVCRSKPHGFLGALLIVIGICWRMEAGIFAVCLTILLMTLSSQLRTRRWFRRFAGTFICCVISVGGTILLWNSWAPWLHADIRNYVEFNTVRAELDGGGNYVFSKTAETRALQSGLSRNDWDLFKNWYFADTDVFSVDRLQYIADGKPRVRSDSTSVELALSDAFRVLADNSIPILSAIAMSVVVAPRKLKRTIGKYLIGGAILTASMVFLSASSRLPNRITEPLVLLLIVWWLVDSCERSRHSLTGDISMSSSLRAEPLTTSLASAWLIAGSVFATVNLLADLPPFARHTVPNSSIDSTRILTNGPPVIGFPEFYSSLVSFHPFINPREALPQWSKIIPLGTAINSPDLNDKIRRLGLTNKLICEVAAGNALVALGYESSIDLMVTYSQEHCKDELVLTEEPLWRIGWLSIWGTADALEG